jgi:hypothetical protein
MARMKRGYRIYVSPARVPPHIQTHYNRTKRRCVFGILAIVFFAMAFLENGAGDGHSAWTSPTGLMFLGLTFLAVHAVIGWWPKR